MLPSLERRPPPGPANTTGLYARAWKESHGNWLLGFAALIFVVGAAIIYWSPPETEDVPLDPSETSLGAEPQLPDNALLVRVTTDQPTRPGSIRIAIYGSKDAFGNPEQAILKDALIPFDGMVAWEIRLDILPNQFAIAAFHDIDDNGKLNRGLFNAPTEPYGFSNNARSLVGPPTYEQTIVTKPSQSELMEIRVY